MDRNWTQAIAGGLAGAVLALAAAYALVMGGIVTLPANQAGMRDYLISHPEILIVMSSKLQQQQADSEDAARQAAVDKVGQKAFWNPAIAYIEGPANAKRTVVEFFDYNCPYCRHSVPALKKYMAAHKADTRYAFIEWAIKGPESVAVAKAAIAARKQGKYLPFHFALMESEGLMTGERIAEIAQKVGLDLGRLQADMNDPTVAKAIKDAHTLAERAKIDGTPTFIIDGKVRAGAVDDDVLKQMTKG